MFWLLSNGCIEPLPSGLRCLFEGVPNNDKGERVMEHNCWLEQNDRGGHWEMNLITPATPKCTKNRPIKPHKPG